MGILNLTPDSFSDGNLYCTPELAVERAQQMIEQGADIIDIGGESTRPGAEAVAVDEELRRVIAVIAALKQQSDILISVDTSKAAVMDAAITAGAGMINDVTALADQEAVKVVANARVPVCIMHMQGQPRTMQQNPHYENVVDEVYDFLIRRAQKLQTQGIKNIIIDPGFGFGKTLEHNITLLKQLKILCDSQYKVLVGISRKNMLGLLSEEDVPEKRLGSSISAALLAFKNGADIIRVHDVKETVDALKIWQAIEQ